MSIPKRHHYVPRFLLVNFLDNEGKLWVRQCDNEKVWQNSPEAAYVERHRYSLIDYKGHRDPALEQTYAVLEGATKTIVDKLLCAARSDRSPNLEQAEKAIWDEFIYHQMKRVPAVTNMLAEKLSWAERLEAAICTLRSRGIQIDSEELAKIRSPEVLDRITQNATVKALAADSPIIRTLLGAAEIEIGVAKNSSAFVIGSRPIGRAGEGLLSASQGKALMWFPIASDVAVRPLFDGDGRTIRLDDEAVHAINTESLRQSDYVAGHSKELVQSIRKPETV